MQPSKVIVDKDRVFYYDGVRGEHIRNMVVSPDTEDAALYVVYLRRQYGINASISQGAFFINGKALHKKANYNLWAVHKTLYKRFTDNVVNKENRR